jgi:hypothetical protein
MSKPQCHGNLTGPQKEIAYPGCEETELPFSTA